MPKKPSLKAIDTAHYVPSLLSVLNNRLSSSASDLYLQQFDVGINEWRIMVVLAREPNVSSKFISEEGAIHQTIISRSIKGMEAKGLVTVEKGKWERLIALSPKGEEAYERVLKVALHREQLLLSGFKPEERELLGRFLRQMISNVALVESIKVVDGEVQ